MRLDPLLELGHPFRMAIGIVGTLAALAVGYLFPRYLFFALLFALVGAVGLWRDLQKRRTPPDLPT